MFFLHICIFFTTFAPIMKQKLLIILCMFIGMTAWSQIKLPQARMLESHGWSVQHSVMSWDSLSIYFSAKAPGLSSYDLYIMRADGWRWSEPQRINALSTDEDETWPSVSSDQGMIFYVVSRPDNPDSQIWRAWFRDNQWTEAAPLIITATEDAQPQIMEDNQTLIFARREQTKKHDGPWHTFTTTMMDDHNWTLPMQIETRPSPQSIVSAEGTILMKKGGRPLSTGQVLVYGAMNEQLLQTASVHPMTGRWHVALQKNRHYRLALTAKGYSYHYINVITDGLEKRERRAFGETMLDDELTLTLNSYDAETQVLLGSKREILPLGKHHTLTSRHTGYKEATLDVNTTRPMVFTETELDIALEPLKSLHHFRVANAQTGESLSDYNLRLNGQPAIADTALRILQEQTLQVTATGYLFFDTLFNTGSSTQERTMLIRMMPLTKDLVLQLRNIQFEYDSYELTESSSAELESIAQLLFMNPTLRIELSAHTDDQGSDRYNDKLSTMRGKAVEKWLLERGVDSKRIVAVGYGKRKPLVSNDSDEHRALNRRVEIKVLDF